LRIFRYNTIIILQFLYFGSASAENFTITNHTDQALFGYKQAIDDNWLVIGALGNANLNQHGKAFVYKKTGTQWLLHSTLQSDNPVSGDAYGSHISMADEQILITRGSWAIQPLIYIYELNDSEQWINTARIKTTEFGHLIAHDYNRIILGHSARVIDQVNHQWIQTHEFFPNHSVELHAVDLDENQVIFGFDEYAEIHNSINGQWQLSKTLQPDDVSIKNDTEFGKSVSIHNNWAGVGAFHDNDNGTWFAGAAYVYQNNDSNWQEIDKLLLSDGEAGDFFGVQINNRKDEFIISTGSPRGIGSYHFKPDSTGIWLESHLLHDANFYVTNSLDHAVACNGQSWGACTIFTTQLFKSNFEQP
jgi:hypothetical protein